MPWRATAPLREQLKFLTGQGIKAKSSQVKASQEFREKKYFFLKLHLLKFGASLVIGCWFLELFNNPTEYPPAGPGKVLAFDDQYRLLPLNLRWLVNLGRNLQEHLASPCACTGTLLG